MKQRIGSINGKAIVYGGNSNTDSPNEVRLVEVKDNNYCTMPFFFDLGEDQYTLGIYKNFEIPESPEGMKIYELISNRIPFVLGLRCKIYNSSKNLDMRITFTDLAITGYTEDGFKITAKTPTAFLYGFGNTADSNPITMMLVVYPEGNIELYIELGSPA